MHSQFYLTVPATGVHVRFYIHLYNTVYTQQYMHVYTIMTLNSFSAVC